VRWEEEWAEDLETMLNQQLSVVRGGKNRYTLKVIEWSGFETIVALFGEWTIQTAIVDLDSGSESEVERARFE
jgi:hypothetical protein